MSPRATRRPRPPKTPPVTKEPQTLEDYCRPSATRPGAMKATGLILIFGLLTRGKDCVGKDLLISEEGGFLISRLRLATARKETFIPGQLGDLVYKL